MQTVVLGALPDWERKLLRLTQGLHAGRTVCTDNFFTSLSLLRELRIHHLGLIGTMRMNHREIPSEFSERRSAAGSSLFGFTEDATMVSYSAKQNRRVVLISSEHTRGDIDPHTEKPEIILTYNHAKGGVDHLDQMCGAYTTRKRTQRWPKLVFQHMIDVSAYNAFVIWREITGRVHAKRREFLKMLGSQLCGSNLDEDGDIPLIPPSEPTCAFPPGRLRCRWCQNKTIQRCSSCGKPLCINCASFNCQNCS